MSTKSQNHISKVALVGATGSLGSSVLSALLSETEFAITLITRPGSITPETHPALAANQRISIKSGIYTDHSFLTSALRGQDAVIINLGWAVCHELQPPIIRAACEVKVPYIIPCEFGSDTDNPALISAIPVQKAKPDARKLIEDLGVDGNGNRTTSWIGIVNNSWYDWSMAGGWFGIDIKARKALFFDDGNTKCFVSTIKLSGLTAAKVLSLPLVASNEGQRTLPSYANKIVYVRSWNLTQRDMLKSVQKATKTTDDDWSFSFIPVKEYIQQGVEEIKKGNMAGVMNLIYGNIFVPGVATDYLGRPLDNEILGLEGIEDLDEETAKILKDVEASGTK